MIFRLAFVTLLVNGCAISQNQTGDLDQKTAERLLAAPNPELQWKGQRSLYADLGAAGGLDPRIRPERAEMEGGADKGPKELAALRKLVEVGVLRCDFTQALQSPSNQSPGIDYSCQMGPNSQDLRIVKKSVVKGEKSGAMFFRFPLGRAETSIKRLTQRGPDMAIAGILYVFVPSPFYAKYKQQLDDLGVGSAFGRIRQSEPDYNTTSRDRRIYDAVFQRYADGWHLVGFP